MNRIKLYQAIGIVSNIDWQHRTSEMPPDWQERLCTLMEQPWDAIKVNLPYGVIITNPEMTDCWLSDAGFELVWIASMDNQPLYFASCENGSMTVR